MLYRQGMWKELFEREYDAVVAYMPCGVVVRGICPYLRNKWVDPAVVVVDKAMRYAIPIIGGHHGGNEIAEELEKFGLKAVITTAMEYSEGLSIGIGCRKGVSPEDVIYAIKAALAELGYSLKDVRVLSTAEVKRNEKGLVEAASRLKKPLMFLDSETLNSIDVPSDSEAKRVGLRSVAEGCAIYFSREKVLIMPKRVYRGVTVAVAR